MRNERSPSVHEIVATELERFVARQNIERYASQVAKTTNPVKRSILEKLLIGQRAKLELSAHEL
jgi:hypothetical protein